MVSQVEEHLGKDILIELYMKSGIAEAASRRYHAVKGKSGRTWLYADQRGAADHIYVTPDPREDIWPAGHRGFGGAVLSFDLVNGETLEVKGPWHANADAMYKDADVDLRDQHLTRVLLGRGPCRKDGVWGMGVSDCLYWEPEEGRLGHFGRYEEIAQNYADRLGYPVYYVQVSNGGGASGWKYPAVWHTIADRILDGLSVEFSDVAPLVNLDYAEVVEGSTAGPSYRLTSKGYILASMEARSRARERNN